MSCYCSWESVKHTKLITSTVFIQLICGSAAVWGVAGNSIIDQQGDLPVGDTDVSAAAPSGGKKSDDDDSQSCRSIRHRRR